ncbi:MAG TPA: menaquinone biosynthesis decarboxylase [Bacteroidales bacterium]|nr:MAG: menaquinone biosynthesis decarboxylase [Bacteroidetes bacterium GWE2_42_24]OFY29331.1 MAG: menaquinone biosynthesis decarboxylase [Bacteroidetes bacterium GWF2_43_11]HBZ66702.1 menaquinone biosynthesis decarboxylase [Bacteroidales bacterium]
MPFRNLQEFIRALDDAGDLIHVKAPVSPRLEMTEIADRFVKTGGKALLFENTGTQFPVLLNAFASDRRICMALGMTHPDEAAERIQSLLTHLTTPTASLLDKLRLLPTLGEMAAWMPRVRNGKGECQQVVMDKPDLTKLPILQCWPHDGGPFITFPLVHTRDPHTGMRNLGMYRMQVFTPDFTGMHWHLHKTGARHYNEYKAEGRRMPVVVALGGDPVYTYAATAPLPDNVDEYMLAGFLRRRKVDLVKCLTCDLEVPADTDFVIEGYVDPSEDLIREGPFGDHTGYYSLADDYPGFHVTCITHRRDAVYPATIVGIPPMEDGWIGMITERIFLAPLRLTMLPELVDMAMPVEGVFHNIVVVSVRKAFAGHAPRVMSALWGAGQMMFNKVLVVVDHDVPVHDYEAVATSVALRCSFPGDVHLSRGPMDVLDHASRRFAYGSKMGIDATRKWAGEEAEKEIEPLWFEPWPGLMAGESQVTAIQTAAGLPVLFVAFRRESKGDVSACFQRWIDQGKLKGSGWVIFAEDVADLGNIPYLVWRIANNIDPVRDLIFYPACKSIIALDATRKYAQWDDFDRPWPNIVTMDRDTISQVDARWKELNLGDFIGSPSLPFIEMLYEGGAVAE